MLPNVINVAIVICHSVFFPRVLFIFCAIRKLTFRVCYNMEKSVNCSGAVGNLEITGVLRVNIVADRITFSYYAVRMQADVTGISKQPVGNRTKESTVRVPSSLCIADIHCSALYTLQSLSYIYWV